MSLLAESLVEVWLIRYGYFTIRGARFGVREMDLPAVRQGKTGLEAARNDQIVVALVDNENTSLKEFEKIDRGRKIELKPHNKEMEPQIYDADRVQIQGVLLVVSGLYKAVPLRDPRANCIFFIRIGCEYKGRR